MHGGKTPDENEDENRWTQIADHDDEWPVYKDLSVQCTWKSLYQRDNNELFVP